MSNRELPSSWKTVRVKEISQIVYGKALQAEFREKEGNILVYGSSGIVGRHNDALYEGPSIIIGRKGNVGSVYYVDEPFWCIDTAFYLDKISKAVDIEFLVYALQLADLAQFTKSVAIPGISRDDIANAQIPLPPLPEQRRIAVILREADEIRKLRQQANEKTQKIVESLFYDMFGDPATNPKEWEVLKVEDLLSKKRKGITTGPFGSLLKRSELVDEGIPVWGINNVHPNEFFEAESSFITAEKYKQLTGYTVQEGDILISRAGTVGRICVAYPSSFPSIISTNLIRIVLDSSHIHPEYFTALFTYFIDRLGKLRASGEESSYSFLNPSTLRSLQICVPPLSLQNKFVSVLLKIREIEKQQGQFHEYNNGLHQSLLAQAFSGELTASWREAHLVELEQAAEERDLLLKGLDGATKEPPPQQTDKSQVTVRTELTQGLTRAQDALLALIEGQRDSYFAASRVHDDIRLCTDGEGIYQEELDREGRYSMFADVDCSLDTIRRELHFLAHMGLVKELTLRVEEDADVMIVHYITGYRSLRGDDDCQQQDLVILNPELVKEALA